MLSECGSTHVNSLILCFSETESNEVNDKRCVWLVGHSAFSEIKAAELLVQEAREYLQVTQKHMKEIAIYFNYSSFSDTS